jgi:ProP effector
MSRNAIVGVISLLAEKWPCCFSIPYSQRRPLKLGIREDVLAALGSATSAGKVSAALRWYVSSPEYQRRLVHGAWRVDLNGKPAGIVSQEDEAHARANWLRSRRSGPRLPRLHQILRQRQIWASG